MGLTCVTIETLKLFISGRTSSGPTGEAYGFKGNGYKQKVGATAVGPNNEESEVGGMKEGDRIDILPYSEN